MGSGTFLQDMWTFKFTSSRLDYVRVISTPIIIIIILTVLLSYAEEMTAE